MGIFINKGNGSFTESRNGEYVDKSPLIAHINETLNSERRFSCVTRSRRFGKSMAAKMLCAYYDRTCDSTELFADLDIASIDPNTGQPKYPSYPVYLNKFHVLYIDMTQFVTRYRNIPHDLVERMRRDIQVELLDIFSIADCKPDDDLMLTLQRAAKATGVKFFVIIDEWDALFRDFPGYDYAQDEYINLLRRMFKDESASAVFAGTYMTGILPIKKYKTQSALNNFIEYSMVQPGNVSKYFGFTKSEVLRICANHDMDFNELEKWYDGYSIGDEPSIFNPNSVMMATFNRKCRSFWSATASYEQVSTYIDMDFDGLKDDIIYMLAGGKCTVETTRFANDMHEVKSKDDVFTVLIHLGYLAYDWNEETCYIPNLEVRNELASAIQDSGWRVADAITKSKCKIEKMVACDDNTESNTNTQ